MVTFAHVLKIEYSFTDAQISASYLCPGISLIIGSTIGGWASDKIRAEIIKHNPDIYVPEYRFSLQFWD